MLRRIGGVAVRALPVLPAAFSLVLGVHQAYQVRGMRLDPDVLDFQSLAAHIAPDTIFGGFREPIWPLLFVIPVRFLGDQSGLALRFIGVLGFVFMVIAFQMLAAEIFGRVWSIVSSLLLAASPWLVFEAGRGLREETSVALLLLCCLGLVKQPPSTRRFILLFALAGVTGLLRWDTMLIMLPLIVIALVVYRPHPIAWVAGPAVALAIVSPLLIGNYIEHGDPLYDSTVPARFFTNVEFHDQPGFPTSAAIAENSLVGPPTTWMHYVFALHTPSELLLRAARSLVTVPVKILRLALFYPNYGRPPGVLNTLLHSPQALLPFVLWPLGVLGGISLLRMKAWPVPVAMGALILMYSPIAYYVDFRLLLGVLPLLALCVVESIRLTEGYWLPRRFRKYTTAGMTGTNSTPR